MFNAKVKFFFFLVIVYLITNFHFISEKHKELGRVINQLNLPNVEKIYAQCHSWLDQESINKIGKALTNKEFSF